MQAGTAAAENLAAAMAAALVEAAAAGVAAGVAAAEVAGVEVVAEAEEGVVVGAGGEQAIHRNECQLCLSQEWHGSDHQAFRAPEGGLHDYFRKTSFCNNHQEHALSACDSLY
jgi:hypothetical protein